MGVFFTRGSLSNICFERFHKISRRNDKTPVKKLSPKKLGCWIFNPDVSGSHPSGSSIFDSAVHPSEVGGMTTENSGGNGG